MKEQEKAIQKNTANFEKLEQKCREDLEGVTTAQKHFQAVSAGLSSSDDGQDATLADQLMGKERGRMIWCGVGLVWGTFPGWVGWLVKH